ncbi:NAD(+)--rifampin ADP-ribosyltransferase [Staphylococcus gallinarum]|uniref:NAD(+)--rifampin ADP-ribosyltransferase n=1 Tax=Staphylococcus gallinarum TaxID=1293 RepID=A0A3A0W7K6_STAGA|nr:NAD(+)--rifampin ADP-ribosyltransferase [Staphylococcus gallinarum]RIP37038.1 NAD(+)--rifampin ADP-ribosyltransferase [Staphylococcus gallinarum]
MTNSADETVLDKGPFFHGTKAQLKVGDLLVANRQSNYQDRLMNHIYFTATLEAAKWGAELAVILSSEKAEQLDEHIYIVEPLGEFEDDPNVTDKKFPGNPTRSYRSQSPLKIVGELGAWERHSDEMINEMLEGLQELRATGADIIED